VSYWEPFDVFKLEVGSIVRERQKGLASPGVSGLFRVVNAHGETICVGTMVETNLFLLGLRAGQSTLAGIYHTTRRYIDGPCDLLCAELRKLKYRALQDLLTCEWEGNPKAHDIDEICASIRRFGFTAPILFDETTGRIVAGHGRLTALAVMHGNEEAVPDGIAKSKGDWLAPVVGVTMTDEKDAAAYLLADNALTERGGWNELDLEAFLVAQQGALDVTGTGFSEREVLRIIERERRRREEISGLEDEVPEPPREPVTKVGDLWQLGDHRLLCGDSTDPSCLKVLRGELAEMVFTDPPYGIAYVGKTKDALTIDNDGADEFEETLTGALAVMLRGTRKGGAWYVCAPSGPTSLTFGLRLLEMGVLRQRLVWAKDRFSMGRNDYHYQHEDIYYGWTPGAAHRAILARTQSSLWEVKKPSRNDVHPTMKPVELVARAVQNSSEPGHLVFDPFAGSGSTLMACEHLGRSCGTVELSPTYCDVIIERWQQATGGRAKRLNRRKRTTKKRKPRKPKVT